MKRETRKRVARGPRDEDRRWCRRGEGITRAKGGR